MGWLLTLRLTPIQVELIRETAHNLLGRNVRVRLFGSRTCDTSRGGDIDLLFETDSVLPNRAEAICRLYGALTMALGERKWDILLKDAVTPDAKIFEIANRTGVLL